MAPSASGSSRRRIAGEAARRRREAAAANASVDADEQVAEQSTAIEDEEVDAAATKVAESPAVDEGEQLATKPARVRRGWAPPPRESWWWLGALAVVTVAALIFVAVVGFRYLGERSDDAAFAESREEATSAAATAAETILTYSYQSLDDDRAAAEKTMTEDFAKEYGELYTKPYCEAFPVQGECTVEGSFPEVIERNKTETEAAVVDVAPMECGDECSDDKASVLMFIDQTTRSDGEEQTPVGNRAVFTMVKQDGDWLVDGIRYV